MNNQFFERSMQVEYTTPINIAQNIEKKTYLSQSVLSVVKPFQRLSSTQFKYQCS